LLSIGALVTIRLTAHTGTGLATVVALLAIRSLA
jgi:hypothetical protein